MDSNQFVGAWRLLSWAARGSEGAARYPYGQDAKGYIVYSADGCVNVAIMAAQRPRFEAGDLLASSVEERAEAAATYLSYAGRYEIFEDKVVHTIELSLFPNWIGTRQERFYELAGNRLTLSTAPILSRGSEQRHFLEWERVAPAK